ncbi:HAMP domain-containing protein [Prauserella endophytica]|uniref:histidine kinase n=1 Tax=Prauserella endophytica TaxID=1592324 RepID=A0ABY2S4I6_9PSEU|nr:HAMP domain-containing protein [Prauserella endophytica]
MTVAGEGQVPVGTLLGQPAPTPSKWRALVRWRDWSLPVKLGAVTLVPIVIALVLGGITLGNQIERSDRYDRVAQLADLGASTRAVLDGLQRERTQTARLLTDGSGLNSPELRDARAAVDRAAGPLTSAAGAAELDGIAGPRQEVSDQLGRLGSLRDQVAAGQVGPVPAVTEYSSITSALLNLDVAVVAGMGDDGLGGTPSALHDLLVAREEVSVQQALIGYGISRGGLAPSEFNQVRTSDVRLTDRLAEFRIAATGAQLQDFDSTVRGDDFDNRDRVVKTVLAEQDSGGSAGFGSTSEQQWADTSGAVFTSLGDVSDRLGGELTSTAGELADGASTGVVVLAVVLVIALLLAAAVVFLITRQLLRSLKLLRTRALEVAEHDLPSAVRTIQEGRSQSTDVQPVPVGTNDEIGEVARAFDAVHSQALRLAVEQAGMRTGYASVFVNLSRRSQSLVQRQLQLIERLERDEEDADQLATLFQLDHLATRMRRNNENLMVLSGAEPGRRSGQPVSTTDVLRAAVSEIEQYQRVVVQPPPQVRVVGYAAGDLVRLVAELLDNATAFSAPETQVTVATRQLEDGSLSIDIMDRGIGMNEAEVTEANARLTEAGSVDLATSRRMGLFVVGRLASRHNFGVALHGGKDIVGVRATVKVPAELVMDGQGTPQSMPPRGETTPQLPQAPQASAPAGQGPGGLPRRQTNGASRPGALPAFSQGTPPPSANEVSGTALFTPIGRDEPEEGARTQQVPPPRWPQQHDQQAAADEPSRNGVVPPETAAETTAATPVVTDGAVAEDTEATERTPAPGAPSEETGRQPDPEKAAEPAAEQPQADDALSGKELFAANSTVVSDWWSAATTASDAERRARQSMDPSETTPIFDEMLSVWFRSDADASASQGGRSGWDFAADERWRAVQAVSEVSPSDYTKAGLPRRRKGEQLLPGSAVPPSPAPDAAAKEKDGKPELPARDPVDVRSRLSSFQQGVSRGRRQSGAAEPETPESPAAQPQAERPKTTASGLPQRQPRKKAAQTPAPAQAADTAAARPAAEPAPQAGASQGAAPASEWAFASDDRWRTVQAVAESSPSSYTAAGLPRRRRGEQLLPGSVSASSTTESRPRTERDPADVRGRLSSFQQGIRRGRHRTAQATESTQEKVEGE